MPRLRRPDGVELHWEERGEGPLVVIANTYFNYRRYFLGLLEDLERDHRVVEYDLRGNGLSTRAGPYDLDTDAADLAAVVEAAGPPSIAVAFGDGCLRAVKAAATHPGFISAVVSPAGTPVGPRRLAGSEGLIASASVVDGIIRMAETDFRAAFRTIVESVNPQLTQDEIRERVERTVAYCPPEPGAARARAWVEGDATEEARTLDDRLWILDPGTNPWIPLDVQLGRTRELLPEARIEHVEEGAYSRPDIAAAAVRELTRAARPAPRRSGARRP
jgi:pimeloyl-ACP methyl ester carboxylesterase